MICKSNVLFNNEMIHPSSAFVDLDLPMAILLQCEQVIHGAMAVEDIEIGCQVRELLR